MKKSITSLLKGWCAALLCAGLTLPSFAAADADAAFAAQRHDLKLSLRNAPLREVVTAFTQQTGVVFSYETSLGERTLPHVDVALNGSTLDEMLASVFAGTGISYKIKDKVVALSAPPQSDAPAARSAGPATAGGARRERDRGRARHGHVPCADHVSGGGAAGDLRDHGLLGRH